MKYPLLLRSIHKYVSILRTFYSKYMYCFTHNPLYTGNPMGGSFQD